LVSLPHPKESVQGHECTWAPPDRTVCRWRGSLRSAAEAAGSRVTPLVDDELVARGELEVNFCPEASAQRGEKGEEDGLHEGSKVPSLLGAAPEVSLAVVPGQGIPVMTTSSELSGIARRLWG
jgi:hypothetical protein